MSSVYTGWKFNILCIRFDDQIRVISNFFSLNIIIYNGILQTKGWFCYKHSQKLSQFTCECHAEWCHMEWTAVLTPNGLGVLGTRELDTLRILRISLTKRSKTGRASAGCQLFDCIKSKFIKLIVGVARWSLGSAVTVHITWNSIWLLVF